MLTALLWGAALAGSESWELAEASWWVDDDAVVREQLSTWELLEGSYVFRIDEGDRPVGVVVVGEGTWHVHFDRTRDARATANRRVATEADPSEPCAGWPRARLRCPCPSTAGSCSASTCGTSSSPRCCRCRCRVASSSAR